MQPKKQLKVQYIGIFEEIDSFYWQKMHFLKEGQKIWAGVDPPPPHGGNARKKTFFLIDAFPKLLIFSLWDLSVGLSSPRVTSNSYPLQVPSVPLSSKTLLGLELKWGDKSWVFNCCKNSAKMRAATWKRYTFITPDALVVVTV